LTGPPLFDGCATNATSKNGRFPSPSGWSRRDDDWPAKEPSLRRDKPDGGGVFVKRPLSSQSVIAPPGQARRRRVVVKLTQSLITSVELVAQFVDGGTGSLFARS